MWQKLKTLLTTYQLPILSGIFIGTSYIPFPPWASFFCFIPLWVHWWQNPTPGKCFRSGWMTGFVLTLIGFNWVAYLAHEFGRLPWALAIVVLLVFAAIANIYLAFAGFSWAFFTKKLNLSRRDSWMLLPLLVFLFEWLTPTIFPWNYGYTWYWAGLPLAQLAEYFGFVGLSGFTIAVNLGFFATWMHRRSRKLFVPLSLTALSILLLNGWGLWVKNQTSSANKTTTALIVQANIGNLEKVYAEKGWGFIEHIKGEYFTATQKAIDSAQKKIDFVVWPETAYPEKLSTRLRDQGKLRELKSFAEKNQVNMVVGAYSYGPRTGKTANSIFVFDDTGGLRPERYSKNKLLVFGEYIPLGDEFPVLYRLIPSGRFEAGRGATTLPAAGVLLGPQICYESLFPGFTKKVADLGAQMIVNVTNDSWYGKWQEPYQHLYMTLARSIEFRRPVVRSTNTGISTVALASGEVLETSPLHKKWSGLYEIPYEETPTATFYQRFPWLIQALGVILILLTLGRALFGKLKKS